MTYPSTIATLSDPQANDRLNSPSHSAIEQAQNANIEAIENFIGIDGASSIVGTLIYDVRSPASDGGGHVQSANKGGTGQTSYTKGDILVGSSSSVLTKLAVGSDGQSLIANPASPTGVIWGSVAGVPTSVLTLVPKSPLNDQTGSKVMATNTTGALGLVSIPFPTIVNYLTIRSGTAVTTPGTFDITLYRETGQSSVFTVVTPTVSNADTNYTAVVSSVAVAPGNYYVMANTNGTTNAELVFWNNVSFGPTSVLNFNNVTGQPKLEGTYTIPAGAPPSSIVSSVITSAFPNTVVFRLN